MKTAEWGSFRENQSKGDYNTSEYEYIFYFQYTTITHRIKSICVALQVAKAHRASALIMKSNIFQLRSSS